MHLKMLIIVFAIIALFGGLFLSGSFAQKDVKVVEDGQYCTVDEGIELRQNGITENIVVLRQETVNLTEDAEATKARVKYTNWSHSLRNKNK